MAFDDWLAYEFSLTGGFTMLVVLVEIGAISVTPLRSTYLHVIGGDVDWIGISQLFASAQVNWDGALFETVSAVGGGPVIDPLARAHLRELEARIGDDRLAINNGHFFDKWGRRMRIDEVDSP